MMMMMNVTYNKPLYHVTDVELDNVLSPRIPKSMYQRTISLEENITERISFSTSIEGCLLGLQLQDSDIGQSFNVYVLKDILNGKVVTSKQLANEGKVFDVAVTDEHWVVGSNVIVEKVFSIKITEGCREIWYRPCLIENDPEVRKIQELICKFPNEEKVLQTFIRSYDII